MADKRLAKDIEESVEKISAAADERREEIKEAAAEIAERRDEIRDDAGKKIESALEDAEREAEKRKSRIESALGNDDPGKIRRPLKVFAVLCLIVVVGVIAICVLVIIGLATSDTSIEEKLAGEVSGQKLVLDIIYFFITFAQAVLFAVFSVRILRNNRRNAALLTDIMLGVSVLDIVFSLMTAGLVTFSTIYASLVFIFLVVMHSTLDPTLADERRLQRKLQDMEIRSDAEAGVLGRDKTGEGFIELNFFNLFWIFVVACFLGWCFEMAVCPILNGRIEDRTGMLFGPFSPIYGIGATLMTIALNRFYKKNPIIVFLIAGLIGAGFEFFVHWFFQNAFGIMAWDYSGEFLNIQGRTDFLHFVCWGCLGLIFVRWLLPLLLRIVNMIPWNWRYGVTCVCAAFMIVNGAMTLLSFDCWYQRMAGHEPDTPVAQFFADNYGNDFMAKHFPTMSIDPSRTTHN